MSFGKLLLVGVATLVFITLATGAVSIAALHRTTMMEENVARDFATDLLAVERLRFQEEAVVASTRTYLLTHDSLADERFTQATEEFKTLLTELHARGLDRPSELLLKRLDAAAMDYMTSAKALASKQPGAPVAFESIIAPKRELFEQQLTEFVELQQQIFDSELRAGRASATNAQIEVMVSTALGLVLSAALAVIVMRNLTRHYDRERTANEAAQREAAARKEVLAVVSHDLRSPLNAIVMGASLLSETLPATGTPMHKRQLAAIRNAADRMTHMIGEVLDDARIDAGTLTLHRTTTGAAALLDDALQLFHAHAADRAVHAHADAADRQLSVWADRERVLQILSNLISNAMKFTPKGGEIVASAIPDGSSVRFSIRDTGPGIPPENLEHLFDRYWQGSHRNQDGSLGLGLYICKKLVEAQDGRIWVETAVGQGSEFCFTLPARAA